MPSRASFICLCLFSFLTTSFRASAQNFFFIQHYCASLSTTTFTRNSTYFTNHKTPLSSLSSPKASYSTGFQSATFGEAPDMITGLFLCRGDVTPEICRNCVAFAVNNTQRLCPNEREALIYYDECMLRYSDRNILSTLTYDGALTILNGNISSDHNQIYRYVDLMLSPTAVEVANSSRKFYVMKSNWTARKTLYVLAQCTHDLTRVDCLSCLQYLINAMALYRIGGRTLYPSCNSRYELYEFYKKPPLIHSLRGCL